MNDIWNDDIKQIHDTLQGEMRLIGGCVRDFLLGLTPHDFDIATPIKPQNVLSLLQNAGIKTIETTLKYGVITAIINSKKYEITTLRRDEYRKKYPDIYWVQDYGTDAHRRDFTINALSMDKNGTIYDYLGGREDLANHIVRFIGDPEQRIWEDPLRICRYVRFCFLYGNGEPDKDILEMSKKYISSLPFTSRPRRHKEILKILTLPRVSDALTILEEIGALQYLSSKKEVYLDRTRPDNTPTNLNQE